jgi:hypothetical protein
VVGRKRHLLTGTDGRLLMAAVSPADLLNSDGGKARCCATPAAHGVSGALLRRPRLHGHARGHRVAIASSVAITIACASKEQKGFAVHPRRPA